MNPRGTRGVPAPAAPPGANQPTPAPGAGGATPRPAATAGTDDPAAGDGTNLNDAHALTRWRVPISTRFGALVLTLYTDRHAPTGDTGTGEPSMLTTAAGRLVGGLFARDAAAIKSAAGDVLQGAADVLSHVHLGLHWKPSQPIPTPEPTPAPIAPTENKGPVGPTPGG